MSRDLQLIRTCDLSDALGGRRWVSVGVGPGGEAVMLLADDESAAVIQGRLEQPGRALFPDSRTRRRVAGTVLFHDGENAWHVELPGLNLAHPHVQPLPDGEALLVGARCRRHRDGTVEHNAHVFGPDGQLRRELLFGDGIEDVQVTRSGEIWVSYFDEGIFGNYGWGGRGSGQPIGASGLVCFDAPGNKLWEYAPPAGLEWMADCYALNVARDAVWAYYYTDFPLVRIGPQRQIRWWPTNVSGAGALAVDGRRVLFFGGYGPARDRCVLGQLRDDEVATVGEFRLVLPEGQPLADAQVVGRGPVLHAFLDGAWYQLDVRAL